MDVGDEEEDDDIEERKPIPRPGSTLCASLRSRNAHGHVTRDILCGNLHEKTAGPQSRDTLFCASLRSQNAHGHFTRTILYGNSQKKCRTPIRRHPFCASRAVEMHIYIAQEQFCIEIYGKMPRTPATTSIKHQALTVAVRTPSMWP